MSEITTVLFDVGWPIIDETEAHEGWYQFIIDAVKNKTGKTISKDDVLRAQDEGITCYSPSLFSYVIWQFVQPDETAFAEIRKGFEEYYKSCPYHIQDGVLDVLEKLSGRFKLGIAANQPTDVYEFLEQQGVLRYFNSAMVSEEIGFSKPDIRMFAKVLDNLGSRSDEAIMVGDRPDNDIIPAKLLGMKTVWLRIGPHKDQKLRFPAEKPDYVIDRIDQVPEIPEIKARLS